MIAAGRLPLRSDPANNQFERPSAHGPAAAQMSEFTLYLGIPPRDPAACQTKSQALR